MDNEWDSNNIGYKEFLIFSEIKTHLHTSTLNQRGNKIKPTSLFYYGKTQVKQEQYYALLTHNWNLYHTF